jgi:oligopeptidase A
VSGISGVEWDAVELPSQFMENFCWEWDVLQHMTAHVKTGEPLPRALYDKMLAAKNFQSGMQTLRQVEFSLIDMHLHYDFDPNSQQTVQELIDDVRSKFSVMIPPAFNRFQHSSATSLPAAMRPATIATSGPRCCPPTPMRPSRKRSRPAAALSAETGKRFQREILAVGGSRSGARIVQGLPRPRTEIDALLRHSGMPWAA